MHENPSISAKLKPKSKTLEVVYQKLRWALLAKPVENKKYHASEPLTLNACDFFKNLWRTPSEIPLFLLIERVTENCRALFLQQQAGQD
jgi:hypothetical protein